MDVDFVVMTHVLAFILVSQSGICIGSLLKFAIGGYNGKLQNVKNQPTGVCGTAYGCIADSSGALTITKHDPHFLDLF
jgi:hypothetical protein